MDDFRVSAIAGPVLEDVSSPLPSLLQRSAHDALCTIPVADLGSFKMETFSKDLFRPFDARKLIDKFAGSGLFARTLLLQTRLLIMLQVALVDHFERCFRCVHAHRSAAG
jgi:hypothetical protein